jgi:hypothetical protein
MSNHIGYTQVWEGRPTEFITVIKQWSILEADCLKLESAEYPSHIALWVANEHIDWHNLRVYGEYRPTNINNMEYKQYGVRSAVEWD